MEGAVDSTGGGGSRQYRWRWQKSVQGEGAVDSTGGGGSSQYKGRGQ